MTDTLEPSLTSFDRRVLDALEAHAWASAWQVAERVRVDDVGEVRRILDGLAHLHYAAARGFGHRRRWRRPEWALQPTEDATSVRGGGFRL